MSDGHGHSHDPLVNAVTGAPCKGKRAAAVLYAILNRPETRAVLYRDHPDLMQDAIFALAPFDHAKLKEIIDRGL